MDPNLLPDPPSVSAAESWRRIRLRREEAIDRAWADARRHRRTYRETISKALNNVRKLREDEDVQEMARDLIVALEALLSFLINEQSPNAIKVVTASEYQDSWLTISELDMALPIRGRPSNNNFVYLFVDDSRPRDLDISLATVIRDIEDARSISGRGNQIEVVVDVVYAILDLVRNIVSSGDADLEKYVQEKYPGFMGGKKTKKGKRKTKKSKRKTRRTKRRRKTTRKNRR